MKIIYPEDRVRAKFYRQYGEGELVNLFSEEKPTSQLFVDKYLALAKTGTFEKEEVIILINIFNKLYVNLCQGALGKDCQ